MVVQAMNEIGIEIESKSPQNISQQIMDEAQISVNMGCMNKESYPALFLKDVIDWQIQDPKGKSIRKVREIHEQMEQKVKDFLDSVTEGEFIGG